MTTIICSGTIFSGWQKNLKKHFPKSSFNHPLRSEISALAAEICQQQFTTQDELEWKPFTPDDRHLNRARQLLSSTKDSLLTWDDVNCCLYLDFWNRAVGDPKFLLFFSSPEYELGHYLNAFPFDISRVDKVVNAWMERTRAMLTFYMNNRVRCFLIDVQSTNPVSESYSQALNKHFDIIIRPPLSLDSQQSGDSVFLEYLATTLLLQNQPVSALFDEARSAATVVSESARSIPDIQERNHSLISNFLEQVNVFKSLDDSRSALERELYQTKRLVRRKREDNEILLQKNAEQENVVRSVVTYLSTDPLMKIVRQARKTR